MAMKGYRSNQAKLGAVVTVPAAEPVILGLLDVRKHTCKRWTESHSWDIVEGVEEP